MHTEHSSGGIRHPIMMPLTTCIFASALGGTRTPNLLIRRRWASPDPSRKPSTDARKSGDCLVTRVEDRVEGPLRFLLRVLAQGRHESGEAIVLPYEEETMPVLPSGGGVQFVT